MSILINNAMDLPDSCSKCPLKYSSYDMYCCRMICGDGCIVCVDSYTERRNPNCPLVKFPTPLGRLIDADAHIQLLKENQCGERCRKNHDCVNCGIGMYIRIVENEPTILEAEV